ncbi:hypothetical protein BURMUCGD2M_1176 [Burkholderia multivorans CGD2M]|uniref:Uncharacterized protein n=1 Tax=Burkholderia multivorans CGD2 TaxID=513052 RepID=B9BQT3_9BURK|nr:hypothetical protein BURMUCGD2_1086 [Burkholderia multivorans CGD2]EEE13077.1 hypothetical protein BURMUCGD2M_1176 [Burkholderia multivorans CGD2M]QET31220.1 hypothetical protein FOB31_16025 [Burkholderia multivorans]QET41362.1 hypothetical protein FOB30_27840 [Burkholderia multivorans]
MIGRACVPAMARRVGAAVRTRRPSMRDSRLRCGAIRLRPRADSRVRRSHRRSDAREIDGSCAANSRRGSDTSPCSIGARCLTIPRTIAGQMPVSARVACAGTPNRAVA